MDGCRVRRRRNVGYVSMGLDGAQAYVESGAAITAMSRDVRTGALTPTSCLTAGRVPGCARLEARFSSLGGPSLSPDGTVGYVSASVRTPDQIYAVILTVARDPMTGALTPMKGQDIA